MAEDNCSFCAGTFIVTDVLYQDEQIIVIRDFKPAGSDHWLIMPKAHIRDVECLTPSDIPLLSKMLSVRDHLIRQRQQPVSKVQTGFHRGRRKVQIAGGLAEVFVPDVISVRHLHMHVILATYTARRWVKYNTWNPMVWIEVEEVMKRLREKEKGGEGDKAKMNGVVSGEEREL